MEGMIEDLIQDEFSLKGTRIGNDFPVHIPNLERGKFTNNLHSNWSNQKLLEIQVI